MLELCVRVFLLFLKRMPGELLRSPLYTCTAFFAVSLSAYRYVVWDNFGKSSEPAINLRNLVCIPLFMVCASQIRF